MESTIASMSAEEKVGQLFWQLTAGVSEEYLKDLMETHHLGGCRYNAMPRQMVLNQNRILQKYAKVPVFIACNPEQGGNGVWYYPILVNHEKASWDEAIATAFAKLQSGEYAEYEVQKKKEFLANLGG